MKAFFFNYKVYTLLILFFGFIANGYCEIETIDFSKGVYSSESKNIVWNVTSCTILQSRGSSSVPVNSSYVDSPRWYTDHVVYFNSKEGYKISKVVVTCSSKDYAINLNNSTFNGISNRSLSSKTVTIDTNNDFSIKLFAKVFISSIDITYSRTNVPFVSVEPTTIDFGSIEINTDKTCRFMISGSNLSSDILLSISGDDAESFSIDPSVVKPIDGMVDFTDVNVVFSPTVVGKHVANIVISSNGATTKQVSIEGNSILPPEKHDVSWIVNGQSYSEGNPTSSVVGDLSVSVLPSTPKSVGCYTFVGWTDRPLVEKQSLEPSILFNSIDDAPIVKSDVTYYAVFANHSRSSIWSLLTGEQVCEEGLYALLTKNGYAFNGDTTDGRGGITNNAFDFIDGESSLCPKDACILTLEKTSYDNGFTMYHRPYGYLFAASKSANNLYWQNEANSSWSWSSGKNNWIYNENGAYLRCYQDKYFQTYSTNTGTPVSFAKKTIKQVVNDYCTTIGDNTSFVKNTLSFDFKNKDGHWTTYSSENLTFFPSDVCVYTITVDNGRISSHILEPSSSDILWVDNHPVKGTYIPANMGVLLYSSGASSDYYAIYDNTIEPIGGSVNMLKPAPVNGGFIDAEDNFVYYGLAYVNDIFKTGLGFTWIKPHGEKFYAEATTAYLAVPSMDANNIASFYVDDISLGISNLSDKEQSNHDVYNLLGQKLKALPLEGIYIVGNKKVVRKK